MLPLLGGFAILCGLLLLFYLFVNADPARLARIVKWAAIILAVFAVIALIWSERFSMFLAPIAVLLPLWRRMRSMMSGLRGPSAARDSTVETRFIRMTLDHDTGTMSGTVLEGRFAGMRLEELRPPELLALLRECRAEDEEAARLLEAYLDVRRRGAVRRKAAPRSPSTRPMRSWASRRERTPRRSRRRTTG